MSELREAHCHLFQHGRSLGMIALERCGSADALLEAFAAAATGSAASDADSGVLLGQGARPEAWPSQAWPTLDAFDEATGPRPAVAWCFDYHALLANSAALSLAGFADDSSDPEGGVLERDASGRLTGVALERAALQVWEAIPEPGEHERSAMLRAGIDDLQSLGYTEAHDLKAQPWLPRALASLNPWLRVRLWPLVEHAAAMARERDAWRSEALDLGGAKIFVDGTLNSRTAAMLHPFADGRPEHPAGLLLMDEDEVASAIEQADALELPIAAHAIGDRAVRTVLDALERVRPSSRGHRIEHAELIDEADVERAARLRDEIGLKISVQPCHLLVDIEALERAVPDRLDRVLPLRDLIDAGLEPGEDVLFGSDAPIVRADPGDSIRGAVHRSRRDGAAIAIEQSICEDEAWACFGARGGLGS